MKKARNMMIAVVQEGIAISAGIFNFCCDKCHRIGHNSAECKLRNRSGHSILNSDKNAAFWNTTMNVSLHTDLWKFYTRVQQKLFSRRLHWANYSTFPLKRDLKGGDDKEGRCKGIKLRIDDNTLHML